jgi:hypothetical protein
VGDWFQRQVTGDFIFASTRSVFDILVQDSLVAMFPLFGTGTGFRLPAAPDAPPVKAIDISAHSTFLTRFV